MTLEELIKKAIETHKESEKLIEKAVEELNKASGTIWISLYKWKDGMRTKQRNPTTYLAERLEASLKIPEALKKEVK